MRCPYSVGPVGDEYESVVGDEFALFADNPAAPADTRRAVRRLEGMRDSNSQAQVTRQAVSAAGGVHSNNRDRERADTHGADVRGAGAGAGMIRVRDAHLRNLKHQDVELPRNALVAVTGVSGSGKSSLAFGTLHGEAQRRYLESVAPFARRLIGGAVDPRVGSVDGLPPTVALEQGARAGGARSTVGTVSNLSNTVRLLFSRCGEYPAEVRKRHGGRLASDCFSPNTTAGMCPECQGTGVVHEPTEETMVPDPSLSIDEGAIAAWPGAWLGKNFHDIVAELGFPMDVPWKDIPQADREWILFTDERPVVTIHPHRGADQIQRTYEGTWRSVASYLRKTLAETGSDSTRKRVLSFMRSSRCGVCAGRRLIVDALSVEYLGLPIDSLGALPLEDVLEHFAARRDSTALTAAETSATAEAERDSAAAEAERILLDQAIPTLESVVDLGLGHLSLDRAAATLSAGEMQRLRLASQLRSGLFGVAYVLDEPSAGLHPEERRAVMKLIRGFLDAGNSVLLVEHDMHLVAEADWIVDVGPGAGELGGEILYSGPAEESRGAGGSAGLAELDSPTGRALAAGPLKLVSDADARIPSGKLRLTDINERTLNSLNVDFGLGAFTAITGVSGSGKSTLLHMLADTLSEQVKTAVNDGDVASKGKDPVTNPAQTEIASPNLSATLSATLSADKTIDRLVQISQKPIGRTPRSCLATYTGLFDKVRKIFAQTDAAKQRGWTVSRFSYNVTQGRCPTCSGEGQIEVELVFLPGSYTPCPDCHGARYNAETLAVTWNGRTIADVLGLTVAEAREVFADEAAIARALQALSAVGLDYLRLGQPATELSGGEAQRIKLATELQRAQRGHTVYLMDEPTTGLHPADVDLLVTELQRLVDSGNTVVVVEHDMRVVAQADRVIEMGPGAGARGGRVVADGSPAAVAETDTATGRVLAERS